MLNSEAVKEFESVYRLLKEYPLDYIGYKRLGEFYLETNINQTFLCYEQAWGLCDDAREKITLEKSMHMCRLNPSFQVRPVSFIILSYNARNMMIDCLESNQYVEDLLKG